MDKSFVKEVKAEVKRDRILNFISVNKFKIILVIFAIILVVSAGVGYKYYSNYKATVYGEKFTNIKEFLQTNNYTEAMPLLDELIENSNSGYQFIAYNQKASIYLEQGETQKAIDVLKEAVKKISVDDYYKDMVQMSLLNLQLNNTTDIEEKLNLVSVVKKQISNKSAFYYNMLEVYAGVLVENKDYVKALNFYNEIQASNTVPKAIKERSIRVKFLVQSYIKDTEKDTNEKK